MDKFKNYILTLILSIGTIILLYNFIFINVQREWNTNNAENHYERVNENIDELITKFYKKFNHTLNIDKRYQLSIRVYRQRIFFDDYEFDINIYNKSSHGHLELKVLLNNEKFKEFIESIPKLVKEIMQVGTKFTFRFVINYNHYMTIEDNKLIVNE